MPHLKWSENCKCSQEMFSTSFVLVVWTFSLLCCVVVGTLQDTDYQMEDGSKNVFKKSGMDHKKCGNGVLDAGEDCDCGTKCIQDPCCQSTCQFKLNAQCSNKDPCCGDNCMLLRKGSICRTTSHICDIPEYCDGDKSECPVDSYKRNGASCSLGELGNGICFKKACRAFMQPCIESWITTESEPIRDWKKCPPESICDNRTCIKSSHIQMEHSCPSSPQGEECYNHGDCSNKNACVCHPGWTGILCSKKVSELPFVESKDDKRNWPGRKTEIGPKQDDSTSDTIALAGGLVAFVLTVSIMFVCMACRFLPTRTPKDETARCPTVQVETIDAEGSNGP